MVATVTIDVQSVLRLDWVAECTEFEETPLSIN